MKHLIDYQTLYRWSDELYSYTFPLKLAGAHYGGRMIIARAADSQLLLISPLAPPPQLAMELGRLGKISGLVFPTCFHDTGLKALRPLLESAPSYVCPGFEKHLPSARPIDALPDPWRGMLRWKLLAGMPRVNETVFFHDASKSLLISDLLFKFARSFNAWTRAFARVVGAYPQLRPTRMFASFIKDRQAFDASVSEALSWDFERALPSHAETIQGEEARAALELFINRSGSERGDAPLQSELP